MLLGERCTHLWASVVSWGGEGEEAAEPRQTLKHAKEVSMPGVEAPRSAGHPKEKAVRPQGQRLTWLRCGWGAAWGWSGWEVCVVCPGQEAGMGPGTEGVLGNRPCSGTWPQYM